VDFWDLTKLLFRRWYFALPMLALTAAVAMWIISSVQPNYIATAYVQLIPPKTKPTPPGSASIDMRNPWIGLGLTTLANAAIVTIGDKEVVEALADSGYSENFTATLAPQSPLVKFEVTGSTPQQASETADVLVTRYQQALKDLQQRDYVVADADLIATTRLDQGNNLTVSDAKVKRAIVGVVGAGLLGTIALTVGLDTLLRLRARRRSGIGPTDLAPVGKPSDALVGSAGRADSGVADSRPMPRYEPPRAPASRSFGTEVTPAVRLFPSPFGGATGGGATGGGVTGAANGSGLGPPVTLSLPSSPAVEIPPSAAWTGPDSTDEEPTAVTSISQDETVILPLSGDLTRRRGQAKPEGSQPT
jgi:hypothetical protein